MRSRRASRRIVVRNVEYRWRAKGGDGIIRIGIWPANNIGPYIQGNLRYHETWIDKGGGTHMSAGDQIVVTSRIVREIIEHAIDKHGYNPIRQGEDLNVSGLDDVVKWRSAIRATRRTPPEVHLAAIIREPRSNRKPATGK